MKVWLLYAVSGVPVLPMGMCDLEHRNSTASSSKDSENYFSYSEVQTLFQHQVLRTCLALLRLLARIGSLNAFTAVPALVPMLLLLALLPLSDPLTCLFLSFLTMFGVSMMYWLRVQRRGCVTPFFLSGV